MAAILRRLFPRRSLWGWLGLVLWGLWVALSAWSNVDFLFQKVPVLVAWWNRLWVALSALSPYLTPTTGQVLLLVIALSWIILSVWSTRQPQGSGFAKDTIVITPPGRPAIASVDQRWREARRQLAMQLLARAYEHSKAVSNAYDDTMALEWGQRTRRLIADIFGEAEADLFLRADEMGGYGMRDLLQWLQRRQDRLANLIQRFEFQPISEGFDPNTWRDYLNPP